MAGRVGLMIWNGHARNPLLLPEPLSSSKGTTFPFVRPTGIFYSRQTTFTACIHPTTLNLTLSLCHVLLCTRIYPTVHDTKKFDPVLKTCAMHQLS